VAVSAFTFKAGCWLQSGAQRKPIESVDQCHGDTVTPQAFDKFYSWFPSFLDMFPDEDAFLNFAFWFVILTIVGAFVAARFIKIKPHQI
jgi:hypothetical protein